MLAILVFDARARADATTSTEAPATHEEVPSADDNAEAAASPDAAAERAVLEEADTATQPPAPDTEPSAERVERSASDAQPLGFGRVERYNLADNGLQVAMQRDARQPLVAVVVSYGVGSRDNPPGYRELAHLVEHLTFRKTRHLDDGAMSHHLDAAGAKWNGFTSADRTTYVAVLPPRYLPLALWLESERMGFALEAFDEDSLDREIDAVEQEWRQTRTATWGARLDEFRHHAMFPEGHPYRHVADLGSRRDYRFRLAHVQSFYQRHYRPDNARLAIVGDIEPAQARALVDRYFAGLRNPPGEKPPRSVPAVDFHSTQRLTVAWPHPRPFISMDWMTRCSEAHCPVLLSLLCDHVENAIRNELKFALGVASEVTMQATPYEGFFGLDLRVHLVPKADPTVVQPALDQVLRDLQHTVLGEGELLALQQASLVRQLERLEGPQTRAIALASQPDGAGAALDPATASAQLASITRVGLRDAVRTHVPVADRLVMHVVWDEDADTAGEIRDSIGSLDATLEASP